VEFSKVEAKQAKHPLAEVFSVSVEPARAVLRLDLERLWKRDFLKVVQGSDHQTGVLASQLVRRLADVYRLQLIFAPELE
jgi:hypothetical protein